MLIGQHRAGLEESRCTLLWSGKEESGIVRYKMSENFRFEMATLEIRNVAQENYQNTIK